MLDFKNQSFELDELKTGKNGAIYDISHDGLYGISTDTMDEMIKDRGCPKNIQAISLNIFLFKII